MSGKGAVTARMLPSYCTGWQEPIERTLSLQGNQSIAFMRVARDLAVTPGLSFTVFGGRPGTSSSGFML